MKQRLLSLILIIPMMLCIMPSKITNAKAYETTSYNKYNNLKDINLSSRYDSRDYGYVTPVKNQGDIGDCWAFQCTGALEIAGKKNYDKTYDFSEINIAANNKIVAPNVGGNPLVAISYLTSWQGPVLEYDDPYPNPAVVRNIHSNKNAPVRFHIQDAIVLPDNKVNTIKRYVKEYGAVTTEINTYYLKQNSTLYNPYDNYIDHAVLIIGWDDNYSRNNFLGEKPNRNGAFICKNSWGNDRPYIYMSYEDCTLNNSMHMTYNKFEGIDNYENVYAGTYNRNLGNGYRYLVDDDSYILPIMMNEIGDFEEIKALGAFNDLGNRVELYYIEDISKGDYYSRLTEDNRIKTVNFNELGFKTIKLEQPIVPKNKNDFGFVLKIYKNNGYYVRSSPNKKDGQPKEIHVDPFKNNVNSNSIKGNRIVREGVSCVAGRIYTDSVDKSSTYPNNQQNGWIFNDGKWYYFDNGVMQTDFINVGNNRYYLDNNGVMKTGWINVDGNWYYADQSGVMLKGWQFINGAWYFLNNSGSMAVGWIFDGQAWYYLNGNGSMKTGWLNDNGIWYFLHYNGSMAKGWIEISGCWYYMYSNGAMAVGWLNDNGTWYYLNNSGAMIKGWQFINGVWYYFYNSGAMAFNTVIDGYGIDNSGRML